MTTAEDYSVQAALDYVASITTDPDRPRDPLTLERNLLVLAHQVIADREQMRQLRVSVEMMTDELSELEDV